MRFFRSAFQFSGAVPFSIAISLTAASIPVANAAPGDVNSINTGQNIQAGTFFNTPGSRTTFQNPGGGLWLHSGDLVRGLESSINKVPTGNGGTLYFRAPGNVVRLDGNIDVSAVRNGALYTGNGGKVFVDSAYMFQNGSIFANGANGGLVQFNVGGLTMGNNARITAQGFGGDGGTVNVNTTGTVDLRPGSLIDTSGKVLGTLDTNVINIEGSAVNNQGIVRANGISGTDLKPDNGDAAVMRANPQLANNPVPPPITAGNGTHDTATMQNILFSTPGAADFRGGTIRMVASGQTNSTTDLIANSPILSDASGLNTRNAQIVQFSEGDVLTRGTVTADGGLNKNGGTIILAASRGVINGATVQANGGNAPAGIFDANGNGASGGNGGTIVVTAIGGFNNVSTMQANGGMGARAQSRSLATGNGQDAVVGITGVGGTGGQGGVIAVSSSTSANSARILANGGQGGEGGFATAIDTESAASGNPVARSTANAGVGGTGGRGGLIVFSGNGNPSGGGSISINGGQGGNGGTAQSNASASASTNSGSPSAIANGTGGAGGNGGTAGTLVAVNPGTLASTQVFSARAGGAGGTGAANRQQTTTINGASTVVNNNTAATTGSVVSGNNSAILATNRNEYIRHEDAAILLTQANGGGNASVTLTGRFANALIRTVNAPGGTAINTLADAESANSLVIGSSASSLALTADLVNANVDPKFFSLNTLTIANNGNFTNNMLWTPGVHVIGAGFHDMELALGGGHISWLANGIITNNNIVITRGLWSGGSTHVAATQDVVNNNDFINIAPNKALLSGFTVAGPPFEASHAGSLIVKGARDVSNTANGKLESNLIFFDIHPPLNQNPPIAWPRFLNGAQIGASVNLLAGRNLSNAGQIRADALTYRNGTLGAQNPALTIGGIIVGRSRTGNFTNTGAVTAQGNAFFSPNASDGPRFNVNNFPSTTSFNGTVDMN